VYYQRYSVLARDRLIIRQAGALRSWGTHVNEIRFRLRKILADADQGRWSVVLRPEPPAGMMIAQLDELDGAKVEELKLYSLFERLHISWKTTRFGSR
jgi:hypothetical protein